MQTKHKFNTPHFMHLFYEGSILFFYIMGLGIIVALGARGLELFISVF